MKVLVRERDAGVASQMQFSFSSILILPALALLKFKIEKYSQKVKTYSHSAKELIWLRHLLLQEITESQFDGITNNLQLLTSSTESLNVENVETILQVYEKAQGQLQEVKFVEN